MPEANRLSYSDISILYVEDEASTREQVSRILSARGYQLTVAENGERGLELFSLQVPDIVLTDIMMPRLNGLEMARAMRATSQEIQIACMTAFSDTSYLIEAIDIGINQFVLKPLEFHRLFTALDRCQEVVELRRHKKALETENLRAKKIEAIGILAGGMAHDFNNLLQVILGYASLALMYAEPGSKTASMLELVEQSSLSAKELGTRLLTFAKGGGAHMQPTPLGSLVRECTATEINLTHDIKLAFNLPDDLPLVMIDAMQIQQVIAILVINAREAMPDGGLLQISAAPTVLTAANDFTLPPAEYLHILLEDTGTGIHPEILPNIFDPYFTTKEMGNQKGMGLGLSLCYSIIKRHQGHIHAESKRGEWTRIHIYLPIYHST
jgi:signal transduction histidine kinase